MSDDPLSAKHQETYPWLDTMKTTLDASARDLDAATLSRLNRARQAALAQVSPLGRRHSLLMTLASTTGIALAILLWPAAPVDTPLVSVESNIEDFELLSSEDNWVLYSELDFYVWLESQELDG